MCCYRCHSVKAGRVWPILCMGFLFMFRVYVNRLKSELWNTFWTTVSTSENTGTGVPFLCWCSKWSRAYISSCLSVLENTGTGVPFFCWCSKWGRAYINSCLSVLAPPLTCTWRRDHPCVFKDVDLIQTNPIHVLEQQLLRHICSRGEISHTGVLRPLS